MLSIGVLTMQLAMMMRKKVIWKSVTMTLITVVMESQKNSARPKIINYGYFLEKQVTHSLSKVWLIVSNFVSIRRDSSLEQCIRTAQTSVASRICFNTQNSHHPLDVPLL